MLRKVCSYCYTTTPLAKYGMGRSFSSDLICTPEQTGEDGFLSNLKALEPELCITTAYGNILPNKDKLVTVNAHLS
ncbi:hypothetical protein L6164_013105 [Bauhinia variegata]|uniref:Uncharacterized protein n=1 Tax=Bauhinia variegata TaxID=167791 RepID=A0ACB9PEV1_BAUVA|nr:hypothetical protein L6164_013105 [Bauhinia variegata]